MILCDDWVVVMGWGDLEGVWFGFVMMDLGMIGIGWVCMLGLGRKKIG